jgi:hypothetical protein
MPRRDGALLTARFRDAQYDCELVDHDGERRARRRAVGVPAHVSADGASQHSETKYWVESCRIRRQAWEHVTLAFAPRTDGLAQAEIKAASNGCETRTDTPT